MRLKRIYLFCLLGALSASPLSAFAESSQTCQYDPAQQSLTFPDGRVFVFDFGPIGLADSLSRVHDIMSDKSVDNREQTRFELDRVLLADGNYAAASEGRRARVKAFVAKSKVAWLGIEADGATFDAKAFFEAVVEIRKLARARHLTNKETRDLVGLVSRFGGAAQVYLDQDSATTSKLALVPLENADLIALSHKADQERTTIMRESESSFEILSENDIRLFAEQMSLAHSGHAFAEKDIDDIAKRFHKPEARDFVRRRLSIEGKISDLRAQLDDAIVKTALARSGSAALSLSESRRASLISKFQNACEALTVRAPSTATRN